MKVINHVYAIKDLLSRGPAASDFRLSNKLILHYLQIARARLIEQKINRYHFISEQSYQDWCASLQLSNFHACCEAPDVECQVLKSTTPVPKFLNSKWGNNLKVLDLSGRVIPELKMTQNRFSQYALIPVNEGWFMHNNHLYVLNSTTLEKVILNALYNDPEEIVALNCPSSDISCPTYMEEEFPMDSDLIDPMYKLTVEMLMVAYRQPIDTENNFKDVEVTQAVQ